MLSGPTGRGVSHGGACGLQHPKRGAPAPTSPTSQLFVARPQAKGCLHTYKWLGKKTPCLVTWENDRIRASVSSREVWPPPSAGNRSLGPAHPTPAPRHAEGLEMGSLHADLG